MSLLYTPLRSLYAQQARLMPFAGWEMPVQFSSIKQEHQAVRTAAGLFDISHMGKFLLTGPDILAALQRLVPTDLSKLTPGRAQYTVLLNDKGGIVDDLIVYDQGQNHGEARVMLIVNAATTDKDRSWLTAHLGHEIHLSDWSQTHSLIAIQGPLAIERLQALVEVDLAQVPRYGHCLSPIHPIGSGEPAFLARTGYTGEDGFEVMVAAADAVPLWQALIDLGVTPCGLGARDTLRLEAAMALYGQDIDESTTPLEAGLGWLVHLDKPSFMGRDVLAQQQAVGVPRRLVGLQLAGRNIARHGYPVLHAEQPVGTVTSGSLSLSLGYPIALAYVPPELAKVGQTLAVQIRQNRFPATVVKRPFYRRSP